MTAPPQPLDARPLGTVERWTLGLGALAIAVASFTLSRPALLGVALGAGLMVVNAWAMRRIGLRVVKNANRPGAALLLFNLKMALVLGLVYVVVRYLPVDAIGFLIGVSVFPVAILAAAVQSQLAGAPASGETKHG